MRNGPSFQENRNLISNDSASGGRMRFFGSHRKRGVPDPCVFCKGGYHGRVIWMIRVRRALGVKVQTIHTPDLKGPREVLDESGCNIV
jgi:hypothetical protein